jgi:hypothetical protein
MQKIHLCLGSDSACGQKAEGKKSQQSFSSDSAISLTCKQVGASKLSLRGTSKEGITPSRPILLDKGEGLLL